MSRFVAVMGVGRCGSSAVAGMLHRGGVPMGDNLIGPHSRWNARGHFEDRRWHKLNRQIAYHLLGWPVLEPETIGKYPEFGSQSWQRIALLEQYRRTVQGDSRQPIWGRKCIMLGPTWRHVGMLFGEDVRIVVVHRERDAVLRSRMAHGDMDRRAAQTLTDALQAGIDDALAGTQFPVLQLNYEDVIEDPLSVAHELMYFTGYIDFDTNAAEYHIDAMLDHHGTVPA